MNVTKSDCLYAMKKAAQMQLKLFFITLLIALSFNSCDVSERSIDVMSFNIRYDNPADGVNSWDNRKEIVLDFLNKKSPDIIGLQEVTLSQLGELKAELKNYATVAAGRDDGKEKGEMVPVFYNKHKFELISSSHFWLSNTPEIVGSTDWGAHFPRIVTWVQLKNIDNGYIFYVFNTHFSHISQYARNESAVLLLEKISALAGDVPVVVTGDFNSNSNDRSYKTMTGNWIGLEPLWDSRNESLTTPAESYKTFNGFKDDTAQVVIDHIFVNGMFLVQSFRTFPIKKDSTYISDHFPIMASLAFRLNEKRKEDLPKKLMQTLPDPVFETDQLAFMNRLLVPVKLQGNSGRLYYTLDGSVPDTGSLEYHIPIELKNTTTIKVFAYSPKKYPSKAVSKTFIRKKRHDIRVIDITPQPLSGFRTNNFHYLFDMVHGHDHLTNGGWLGIEGTDVDIVCKLAKVSQVNDIYISYLSRPKSAILSPKTIEVAVSKDNINYQSLGDVAQTNSSGVKENFKSVAHISGQAIGQYVKISLANPGIMSSNSNLKGASSWIYIDEIVIQ